MFARSSHTRGLGWLGGIGVLLALPLAACGGEVERASTEEVTAGLARPARPAAAPRPRIVALGDSLTSGLGLPPDQSYPAVLQALLDRHGFAFDVMNAGVSGDTSAGGLRRLDWALEGDVRVLVVALGGNDGLRGLSVDEMSRNLTAIIDRARARGVDIVLCGMEAPPNFGPTYTTAFREAFRALATREGVTFVPFLLDGVAGTADLNQADGIHPNAQGARIVAQTVFEALQPLLEATPRR